MKLAGNPVPIFTEKVKDMAMVLASVENGEISTVKNHFGYEFEVTGIHGFDDITNSGSEQINELDCKL